MRTMFRRSIPLPNVGCSLNLDPGGGYFGGRGVTTRPLPVPPPTFNNDSPQPSSPSGSSSDEQQSPTRHANQRFFRLYPEDAVHAEFSIKLKRLMHLMFYAWGIQVLGFIFAVSVIYPRGFKPEPSSATGYYVINVFWTLMNSLCRVQTITMLIVIYATMFTIASCQRGSMKYADSHYEQLRRYATVRFLIKPLSFGILAYYMCGFYSVLWDPGYSSIFVVVKYPDEGKAEEHFIEESVVVIQLTTFIVGVEFFLRKFLSGKFRLVHPAAQVDPWSTFKSYTCETIIVFRGCVITATIFWWVCLIAGNWMYLPFLRGLLGIPFRFEDYWDRAMSFLDVGLWIRMIFWAIVPRVILEAYVNLINDAFTENISLPIEQPAGNIECLTMSEAMRGDNWYMRFMAFHDFKLKSDMNSHDLLVFYNTTHPGNHPYNFKQLVSATFQNLTHLTEQIAQFLKIAKLTPIVSPDPEVALMEVQLRHANAENEAGAASKNPSTMRDLAAEDFQLGPVAPVATSVYELLKQIPGALWNELTDVFKVIFAPHWLNDILFSGKFYTKMPDKQIANVLSTYLWTYWGLCGIYKLIHIANRSRGATVVHQSLKTIIVQILESFNTLVSLERYLQTELGGSRELDISLMRENTRKIADLLECMTCMLDVINHEFRAVFGMLGVSTDMEEQLRNAVQSRMNRPGVSPANTASPLRFVPRS